MTRRFPQLVAGLLVGLSVPTISACGSSGPTTVTIFSHSGTGREQAALLASIDGFNESQSDVVAVLRFADEGDYNDELQRQATAGELADVVAIDGPLVASFATQGALAPLDGLLDPATIEAALPSLRTQGSWDGRLWALGAFESGLGLFADRAQLDAAGVRVPTGVDDAWSGDEFTEVLAALAEFDDDGLVLDLKRNYGASEWLTYGFAPLLTSAGGGVLDPETGRATGALDSAMSVSALADIQTWAGFVDDNADDAAFVERRVAISWVGHWEYPRYAEALGDDLIVLPLPDLGLGTRSGQGSWTWAIAADADHEAASAAVIDWLLSAAQITAMTDANGAIPGRRALLAASPMFGPNGPLALYANQLAEACDPEEPHAGCVTVARPMTPAYSLVSTAFALAVDAVLDGESPTDAAVDAASRIDAGLAAFAAP